MENRSLIFTFENEKKNEEQELIKKLGIYIKTLLNEGEVPGGKIIFLQSYKKAINCY